MAAAADYEDPDEWELVNDDGFVHKRKKRQCSDPISAAVPPPPDPAVERMYPHERKKKLLLKLKDKYLKEIDQWELLSNTLKEMEHNNQIQHTTSFGEISSSEELSTSNSTCTRLVDDLLFQVEAQETMIGKIWNLCDVAEALCNAQQESLNQQFSDLPIWEPSPNELVTALVDSEVVVKLIRNANVDLHPLGNIIKDCRKLLGMPWESRITHTLRSGNCCADALAAKGHSAPGEYQVWEDPPQDLVPLLEEDLV